MLGSLRHSSSGVLERTLGWAYQDYTVGEIGTTDVLITRNDNGSGLIFEPSQIIDSTAIIVRKDDPDSFAYSGTTRLFSTKVSVTDHIGQDVDLNKVPNVSWGDIRVYYMYNFVSGLPTNYTLAPSFIRDTNIVEIDNLFITHEEFDAGVPDNTDELPEGTTNLYFTDERAINAVGANIVLKDVPCHSSVYIGAVVLMDSGTAYNARADVVATSNLIGVCEAKTTSVLCDIRVVGVTQHSIFAGLDETKEYYLSDTVAGGIKTTPPIGTGKVVIRVGQPFSSTELMVLKGQRTVRA